MRAGIISKCIVTHLDQILNQKGKEHTNHFLQGPNHRIWVVAASKLASRDFQTNSMTNNVVQGLSKGYHLVCCDKECPSQVPNR